MDVVTLGAALSIMKKMPDTAASSAAAAEDAADRAEEAARTLTIDDTLTKPGQPADSKAVGDALANKVDKVTGKGLSTEDYTTTEKAKLAGLTQIEVDDTLTESGEAADAKKTGDEISELKEDLNSCALINTGNLIANVALTNGYIVSAVNGALVSNSGWNVTDYVPLRAGEEYKIFDVSVAAFAFYDINKKFIDLRQNASVCQSNKLLSSFILPDGIFYGRFSIINSSVGHAFLCAYYLPQDANTVDGKFVALSEEAFSGLNAVASYQCESNAIKLDARMYEHGFIDANSNFSFSTYLYDRRCKSRYNQIYPFDLVITPSNGVGIFYVIYNSDGTKTVSGPTFTTNPLTVPKNSAFMLLLSYTQDATVETICNNVTIQKSSERELPNYYFDNNYIKNKLDTIVSKSPLDGLQFAFITDVHCRQNEGISPALIKYFKKYTNSVPFVVFGGDVLVSTVNEGVDILEDARIWQSWINEIGKASVYQVQGNHDYLGYHYVNSERVGFNEPLGVCRQFVIGNLEDAKIVSVPGKLWYYLDISTAKTRIVFLNDYDTTRNDGVFYGYNGMSVDQVRWVTETALSEDDIRVIFVSHQTYDANMAGQNQQVFVGMQGLFKAIANKTAFSYGAITKDFTNSNIQFVAHLCGHMHADASNVDDNVLTIQATCDGIMPETSGRVAGTITEQAFDIVTVDYSNSKLYTTRIGAGNDREFDI